MTRHQSRMSSLIITMATLGLIAYSLPWLSAMSTGLTFGAYDLAEWASLNPAVRSQSPALLTPLLLRMPLACIALILAFIAPRPALGSFAWILIGAVVVIVALLQLPPPSFFLNARGDPNYQQQFMLAFSTLVLGGIGMSGILPRFRPYIALAAVLVAGLTSIMGLAQAYELIHDFSLPVSVAPGSILFLIIMTLIAGALWQFRRGKESLI